MTDTQNTQSAEEQAKNANPQDEDAKRTEGTGADHPKEPNDPSKPTGDVANAQRQFIIKLGILVCP